MAGHSKWANIQHRKKAQDAKRGKLFTRLIREIVVAAKAGGSDLDANPALRTAVEKAKSQSVPKDPLERAIKRGAGELDGSDYEEIRYEGYGPAGIAFIVDCLSDNRNRTVAEVRHAFSKSGGNLGQSGSVAYMFSSIGVLLFTRNRLPLYLNAARKIGLAVRVKEGLKVAEQTEVMHLYQMATALCRPHDDLAWASLRSGAAAALSDCLTPTKRRTTS